MWGRSRAPDVGDVKQHHGQALQAEAKGPPLVAGLTRIVQDGLLHHAAAQDLQPLPPAAAGRQAGGGVGGEAHKARAQSIDTRTERSCSVTHDSQPVVWIRA